MPTCLFYLNVFCYGQKYNIWHTSHRMNEESKENINFIKMKRQNEYIYIYTHILS